MFSEDRGHINKLTLIINCNKQYSGDKSTFMGLEKPTFLCYCVLRNWKRCANCSELLLRMMFI